MEKRINKSIDAEYVNLVQEEGGIERVTLKEALKKAEEAGLDLVEVSKVDQKIPVCKILDYKKLIYEEKRKVQKARKASKSIVCKEVRMSERIDENDYLRHINTVKNYIIENSFKVKVTIRASRGRILAEAMQEIEEKIMQDISEFAKLESRTQGMNGRAITMVLIKR